ncbi:sensor histidine kinase [Actinomadura mexicana]|uniref:histidine kinase n=1 Tax=Actinomadura mexicana TaxID=134959 RepID=A0A238XHJ1_9ACTN|nr:nitrate- and nitrite sensing domain-containing protein [Actinomadura mexicana]SNR58476.1 Signal transduction histidine kinase [Actinomadura mexicana]
MTKPEQVHGSRGRPRTRPVGRRIAMLLAIPLAALVALWVFSAGTTLSAALQRSEFTRMYKEVGLPAGSVIGALQRERATAVAVLAARTDAGRRAYADLAAKTDAAVASFRSAAFKPRLRNAMGPELWQRMEALNDSLDQLEPLRTQITQGAASTVQAIDAYSGFSDSTFRLLTTFISVNDTAVYRQSAGITHFSWASDFMLREDALMSAAGTRRLSAVERTAFAGWAGNREQFFSLARTEVTGELSRVVEELATSAAYGSFTLIENQIRRQGLNPGARQWRAGTQELTPMWFTSSSRLGDVLNDDLVEPAGHRIMLRFYLACVVGLLIVAASVALSVLFARRLARELRDLQASAQRLAHERLPAVVARLRRGEKVDVDAEAPRPEPGRTREIALVADAFDAVQRTAVGTAVGEAELRASINRVFINLSWRSQSLLHRQLRLLDQMERRAASPEELDDLFRLDHLTTRMRRHAEGLVILSGSPTVRAWDHPVAAEDVVRAAIAEVEDYTRVEVTGASSAAVTGDVVADVIHLLAELIENAASFSPPATEVTVKVETVANGLAVEVVDRGVGLEPDELAELNRRLDSAAEFDLVDTERLGLFVVARLAARHGIQVSLQPSPYGGTTAIVLVPHALVVLDDEWHLARGRGAGAPQPVGSAAHGGGGPARLGRPARPALPGRIVQAQPSDEVAGLPAGPGAVPPPAPPSDPPLAPPPDPPEPLAGRARPNGAEPRPGGVEDSEVTGRLPRRVRQRALAPQLRGRSAPRHAQPAAAAGEDDFEEPNPELSRDLMASLQSGWLRGRVDDEPGELDPRDEWGES